MHKRGESDASLIRMVLKQTNCKPDLSFPWSTSIDRNFWCKRNRSFGSRGWESWAMGEPHTPGGEAWGASRWAQGQPTANFGSAAPFLHGNPLFQRMSALSRVYKSA